MTGPIDIGTTPTCDLPGYLSNEPDYERIFDNIQAMIPGVTTDMVALVVWNTVEDFYQRSTYRREHIFWRMDPGVSAINFDPYDAYWRVCRFMDFCGLSRVKFEPPGRVLDLSCQYPETTRCGQATLALKPDNIQVRLPYDVWSNYFECLLNGCLSRLYMQPAKPWSDLRAMQLHAQLYRRDIASARAQAQASHIREGAAWHFPYFASGGAASGRSWGVGCGGNISCGDGGTAGGGPGPGTPPGSPVLVNPPFVPPVAPPEPEPPTPPGDFILDNSLLGGPDELV